MFLFLCDLFKDYKKRIKKNSAGDTLWRFPAAVNVMLKLSNHERTGCQRNKGDMTG